jgi:sugar phosphate isomerase/epimerase
MAVLSAFGDEIAVEIDEQIEVLQREGVRYLELRAADGIAVLDLTDDKAAEIKTKLDDAGIGVSSIGSPIGKVDIGLDFAPHLDKFRRALELALFFGAKYMRIFSYFMPEGADPAEYRDEVIRRMEQKVELAAEAAITLCHENESHIYGDIASRCHDLLSAIRDEHFQAILDPANFVINDVRPYDEGYLLYPDRVVYMHIKDALIENKEIVPAGEGDGQIPEIFAALAQRGYTGFLSLEPHLVVAESSFGFTGPEAFARAAAAVRKVAAEAGLTIE